MEELIPYASQAVLKRSKGLAPKEQEVTNYALGGYTFDVRKQLLSSHWR